MQCEQLPNHPCEKQPSCPATDPAPFSIPPARTALSRASFRTNSLSPESRRSGDDEELVQAPRGTRPEGLDAVLRGPRRPKRRTRICCTFVAFDRPWFVVVSSPYARKARNILHAPPPTPHPSSLPTPLSSPKFRKSGENENDQTASQLQPVFKAGGRNKLNALHLSITPHHLHNEDHYRMSAFSSMGRREKLVFTDLATVDRKTSVQSLL